MGCEMQTVSLFGRGEISGLFGRHCVERGGVCRGCVCPCVN